MTKLKANWPASRLKELDDLRRLLQEVQTLNRGNCVIERIQLCIKLAARLDRWGHARRRRSFTRFLESLAYTELDGAGELQ